MSDIWYQISGFTLDIKNFAKKGDYNSAIILSEDLTKLLKSKKKSQKSSSKN